MYNTAIAKYFTVLTLVYSTISVSFDVAVIVFTLEQEHALRQPGLRIRLFESDPLKKKKTKKNRIRIQFWKKTRNTKIHRNGQSYTKVTIT